MNYYNFIPGILNLLLALFILLWLMHYAPFYAPSYLFWTGVVITVIATISLFHPLALLFIPNHITAIYVLCCAITMSVISLLVPPKQYHTKTNLAIDTLLPVYSFNEYHEVIINASIDEVKHALQTTGVRDIPVILLLMKIRGISEYDKDMSDLVTNNQTMESSFKSPDFNFIVANPFELLTLMIMKASAKTPPPAINTLQEFKAFSEPGYVKIAVNFLFKNLNNGQTLVSTETRNFPLSPADSRIFGRYWRIIYPGSAIIRRLWLNTIARKAEQKSNLKKHSVHNSSRQKIN
jgi:hypothetical protein